MNNAHCCRFGRPSFTALLARGSVDYPYTTGSQTDRVVPNGTPSDCSSAKAYPGTVTDGSHTFDEYDFTNLTGTSNCVQATYNYISGPGEVFSVAYDGSFDATNVASNYLADGGNTVKSGSPGPQTYSFATTNGETFPIVMSEVGSSSGTSYTLSVAYTDDLVINGTNLNDNVVITATSADSGSFQINGGDTYQFTGITSLHVNLGGGNNTLTINNPAGGLLARQAAYSLTAAARAAMRLKCWADRPTAACIAPATRLITVDCSMY